MRGALSFGLLCGWLTAVPVFAQTVEFGNAEVRTFSAERMRLLSDPGSKGGVIGAELGRKGDWDAALWIQYSKAPIVLNQRVGSTVTRLTPLLDNQASAIVTGSYAVFDNLRLHTRFRTIPLQGRNNAVLDDLGFGSLETSGTADPVFGVRFQGLDGDAAFSVGFEASMPWGTPENAYITEQEATFRPEVSIEFPAGPFTLNANGSILIREPTQVPEFGFNLSDELNAAAALTYTFKRKKNQPFDIYAAIDYFRNLTVEQSIDNESGYEVRGGVDYPMSKSISIRGGVGAALDGAVGTPDFRVYVGAVAFRNRVRAKGPRYETLGEFAVCIYPRDLGCSSNDPLCIAPGPPFCQAREGDEGDEGVVFRLEGSSDEVSPVLQVDREWWEKVEALDLCKTDAEVAVYFPVGSELDSAAYRTLDRFVATLLQRGYRGPVRTVGHDTARGAETTEALNERKKTAFARARTVRNYLVFRGLSAEQLLPYQAALSPATGGSGVLREQKATVVAPSYCRNEAERELEEDDDDEDVSTARITVVLTKKVPFWLDGKRIKEMRTRRSFELEQGAHELKVKVKRKFIERKISVEPGEPLIVRFDIAKRKSSVRPGRKSDPR